MTSRTICDPSRLTWLGQMADAVRADWREMLAVSPAIVLCVWLTCRC